MSILFSGSVLVIVFTMFVLRRWWLRRSSEQYYNFDNPIYRKPEHQNGSGVTHSPGIPRSGSHVELIEAQECGQGDSRTIRFSSEDTESPTSSDEHVYRPVSFSS